MLVPMIGIVQVGQQPRADRYTYLSMIGLYVAVTWGACELFARRRRSRQILVIAALLIVTALVIRSYGQTPYWRNTKSYGSMPSRVPLTITWRTITLPMYWRRRGGLKKQSGNIKKL